MLPPRCCAKHAPPLCSVPAQCILYRPCARLFCSRSSHLLYAVCNPYAESPAESPLMFFPPPAACMSFHRTHWHPPCCHVPFFSKSFFCSVQNHTNRRKERPPGRGTHRATSSRSYTFSTAEGQGLTTTSPQLCTRRTASMRRGKAHATLRSRSGIVVLLLLGPVEVLDPRAHDVR